MNIQETEEYFGSLMNACQALLIKPQNITKWRHQGYIPHLQQYKIAEITGGKLKPDAVNPRDIARAEKAARANI